MSKINFEDDRTIMIENNQFNKNIIIKYKNEIIKLKNKTKCYMTIILLILIVFWNLTVLLDVDKTKSESRTAVLTRAKFFVKKCFEGVIINNNNFSFYEKPKISVVIPVYNCKNTIKAAVRSIQNQNMSDIEIFLVNDLSNDTTPKIIQELSEKDPRIKIINNKNNMGTLYSRNIGILKSEGKYIMNLDNDDLFMDIDVFDVVYKEAEKGNYDIVGFGAVDSPSYDPLIPQMNDDFFHHHKDGLIVRQPELKYFSITRHNRFSPNDYHVWGRLMKTDLYKKAINNMGITALGDQRNLTFLSWAEDSTISMVLFKYAESYKFIQKYGIFHYISRTTASFTTNKNLVLYSEILLFDMIFDFTDNNFEDKKKYVVGKAKDLKKENFFNYNNERNVLFLKEVFKKILKCDYITEKDKNDLKKVYKELDLK